jgi:hypothetical protein
VSCDASNPGISFTCGRQGHPEAIDEGLDEAHRILAVDVVVQGFGDKQQLETVMTGDMGMS